MMVVNSWNSRQHLYHPLEANLWFSVKKKSRLKCNRDFFEILLITFFYTPNIYQLVPVITNTAPGATLMVAPGSSLSE